MNQKRKCPLCLSGDSKLIRIYQAIESSKDSRGFAQHDNIPRCISKCLSCGMVFVSNSHQVDMSNEGFKSYKPSENIEDANFYSKERLASNHYLMKQFIKLGVNNSGNFLDFGCGYGGFLKTAKNLGYEAIGIEPCLYRANYCRKKLGTKIFSQLDHEIDYNELPEFDLVVSDQVFEHLEHPLKSLNRIVSKIKTGGHIWICVPNWKSRLFSPSQICNTHYNYFNPRTLSKLVEKSELQIVSTKILVPNHGKVFIKKFIRHIGLGSCSVMAKKIK